MTAPRHVRSPPRARPRAAALALAGALASWTFPAPAAAEGVDVTLPYAIQLRLTATRPTARDLPDLQVLKTHRVYVSSYTRDGKTWYRLRVGFFATAREAARHHATLEPFFPGNWVTKVPWEERSRSAEMALAPAAAAPRAQVAPVPPAATGQEAPPEERIEALMEAARQALAEGRYADAVRTYTKVLEYPEGKRSRDALELLGLARERGGQVAHAKAIYEDYLERYPEGEASDRVRQRLAGLLTAREPLPEKLRAPKSEAEKARWDTFGGLSQFYRRSTFTDPDGNTTVGESSIATDLDITARRRTERMDVRARVSAGHVYDLLSDGPGNETRVSSLYGEVSRRTGQLSARLGRQSRSTGGVLGRFDGLLLGLGVTPRTSLSLVGGYPVASSTDTHVDTDRYLYGVTYNLGTFAEAWDMNVFYIAQMVGSIQDREAVGGELRYFRPTRSFFALVDYDILFEALNTFLFVGSWTTGTGSTWNLTVDERKSPVLTTSNALIGQLVTNVDALLAAGLTEAQVRQMARDQTATYRMVTLGSTRPINGKFQVSGSLSVSDGTGTRGTDFPVIVAPLRPSDAYSVSADLTGSSLIKQGDIAIFGLRYANSETSDTSTLSINTRYPINGAWRVNPRLRLDFRQNDTDGSEQWTFSPSLRTELRMLRRVQFEVEASGDWSTRRLSTDTERTSAFYLSAGYRFDF